MKTTYNEGYRDGFAAGKIGDRQLRSEIDQLTAERDALLLRNEALSNEVARLQGDQHA